MLAMFISMIRNCNCNGFKVKTMKYQPKKQIGLVLNKNYQYNIPGFDLNMPSDPKGFRDSSEGLVKVTKIIWWSIWIQMDFNRNFT